MPARRRAGSRKRVYRRRSSTLSDGRRYGPRQVRRATRGLKRAVRKSKCHCPVEMSPGAKFPLAQMDPFHVACYGAKVPDSNTQPSIANTDVEQVSLAMGATAANLIGMAFRPQYTWGTVAATTGLTLAWGATYTANSSNRGKRNAYVAAIELTRPVAHAIRLSSPVAPTTATGFVHIAISTETTFGAAAWQFPTTVAEISGCQFYKRVTLASLTQSPITVINKWIDDTGFRYSAPASDLTQGTGNSFQTDFAWGAIVVIVEGAPISQTVLSAEHLLMSEGIPLKDSPLIGTSSASNSPGVLAATSEMQANNEPFHTEAEQDSYVQRSFDSFAQGAREQGERVFEQYAVPLAGHVGRAAVSTGLDYLLNRPGISGVNANPDRLAN